MAGNEPYDHDYWGPNGIDLSRWGPECARGIRYQDMGPVKDGQKGAVRKLSRGSRKARGMASAAWIPPAKASA
jgi:hypothetical protein